MQSKHPKLDGVLFHFYSKTLAVITNARLTHFDDAPHDNTASTSTPGSTASTSRRTNKWFDLEIGDYDIFREEVRLWRNISTLVPASMYEVPASLTPAVGPFHVPAMVLDVILDTSSLTARHLLTMDQVDADGLGDKVRVRVDGKGWGTGPSSRRSSTGKSREEQESEMLDSHRKAIVLESWKLELGVCNPPDPPDLPTLYRHATAHLKELFSLSKQLPAYSMYLRLQQSIPRKGKVDDDADLLRIGVRLGVDKTEHSESDDEICGLHESLGPETRASGSRRKVTESFTFPPLLTAIGIIYFSVEYRVEADFYVEDLDVVKGLRDLELDEDYFHPSAYKGSTKPLPFRPGPVTQQQSPLSGSPSSQGQAQDNNSKPRSLLSTTSDRRQSILAAEAITTSGGSGQGATPSPPTEPVSRSPGPAPSAALTSVFGTSLSTGKPVAGLSSLRRSPSGTSHGSSPTTTMTPIGVTNTSSSPVGTSVLPSDAAFLTHGRRTSMSERRLRTLSTLSGSSERGSPPTTAASTSPSYQLSGRPILARATASALPSLRSGSYSPSSPSPLAQQLSDQQQSSVVPAPQAANFRMSSSPSFRTVNLPLSASPNLRSVFQSYTPSQSQTSISSLSRTPPKSITEGAITASNSTLGLQGTSAASSSLQHSPSQSSLAEGRRQPSVAPQMIKRYSSTFNYRQGRQQASALSQGAGGATGSSLENEGAYSKSWQARVEQRQMFAARSLGREEGSPLVGSSSSGAFFTSSYSPQARRHASTSQEDDLDDFVRMIDSSHPEDTPSSGSGSQGPSPMGRAQRKTLSDRSYSTASSSVGFNRQYGLSRCQVDEMLNKMQSSVREFGSSTTSRESGGPSSAGSGQSTGQTGAGLDRTSPPVNQASITSHGASPSFARSPLSKVGFSAHSAGGMATPIDAAASTLHRRPAAPESSAPAAYRYEVPARRDLHTQSDQHPEKAKATSTSAVHEQGEESQREEGDGVHRHNRRTTSGGSLELYANQPHSYDPLEDEAVGRLELLQDEVGTEVEAGRGGTGQGGARAGPGGHHNHLHHHHHHHSPDVGSSEAVGRRRAELARNFGQVVSSSSNRGNPRASLSPWRNRLPSQANNHRGGNGGATNGAG